MPITVRQLEVRKNHIGASDMPAILGMSPYPEHNQLSVYMEKVHDTSPSKVTPAMERGNWLEESLLKWGAHQLGHSKTLVINPPTIFYKDIFCCHLDGRLTKEIELEAKSTDLTGDWGAEFTDDIPLHVLVQVQTQLMCCEDLQVVYIATALPEIYGKDFDGILKTSTTMKLFTVKRNEKLISLIEKAGMAFWNNHYLPKIPPPADVLPNLELLKRIKRVPESSIRIEDDEIILDWDNKRHIRLDAAKEEKEALKLVLLTLGKNEEGVLSDGSRVTNLPQKGADIIDCIILRTKYEDIYNEVATPNTVRMTRYSNPARKKKKGKKK